MHTLTTLALTYWSLFMILVGVGLTITVTGVRAELTKGRDPS